MSLQYHESVFAFLDLLGVKEKLQDDDGSFLNQLNSIYKSACIDYEKEYFRRIIPRIKSKAFSDNIIFDCAISGGNIVDAFESVAFLVAIFQEHLLESNLLLRGAITMGNAYTGKLFVLGSALVKSYSLESTAALYPRVIVDNALSLAVYPVVSNNPCLKYMCREDRDGIHYIDYLHSPGKPDSSRILFINESIKRNEKEMEKHSSEPLIQQKLIWHDDYLHCALHEYEKEQQQHQFNMT